LLDDNLAGFAVEEQSKGVLAFVQVSFCPLPHFEENIVTLIHLMTSERLLDKHFEL
jgi:hypothetical protein